MKISYEKALHRIEKFMGDSGIRDFCSNHCYGACCTECYTSTAACHKNESRRLACSFFICFALRELLFNDYEQETYQKVSNIIIEEMRKVVGGHRNVYFTVNDKVIRDAFKVDIKILSMLNKLSVKKIQYKIDIFLELHRQIIHRSQVDKNRKEERSKNR